VLWLSRLPSEHGGRPGGSVDAAVTSAAAGARRCGRGGGGDGRGRGGRRGAGAGAGAAARVARPPRAGDGPRGGRLRRAAGERGRGPQRARVGCRRLLLHPRLPWAPVRGPRLQMPFTSPAQLRSTPSLGKRLPRGSAACWNDRRGRGVDQDVTCILTEPVYCAGGICPWLSPYVALRCGFFWPCLRNLTAWCCIPSLARPVCIM